MGEVFRARDTRLNRIVAIKVLPSAFSLDVARKARFDREAKAISQLNHPNVCSLFDVGHQDGVDYLVMELLDGETLADRLSRGPLPLADVIRYGAQIAEALEKAHRTGIVHRDLKPQNVMLTKTGAKLLDFGIAKNAVIDVGGVDDPTVQQITREGTIVGTFHYISPEQLNGEAVDARSDIFALGAVLYEMVTGKRAFEGATKTSVIAAIVSGEPPPIANLQPLSPRGLEQIIRACLMKDRDARMQSAHDVALQLRWLGEMSSVDAEPRRAGPLRLLPWALVVVLAGLLAYAVRPRPVAQPLQFNIDAPPGLAIDGVPAISPDGRRVVIRTVAADRSSMLWLRSLDSLEAQPLKNTEGVNYAFWSADGKNIGFTARGKLWRLDPADGSVRTIYEPVEEPPGGATWNKNDVVIFAPTTEGALFRVSASGGPATRIASTDHQIAYWPAFLPDGDHFLYMREFGGAHQNGLYVGSITAPETKLLVDENGDFTMSRTMYADGNLYYVHGSSLYKQAFDAAKLVIRGEPVKIDDNVQFPAPGRASFGVSEAGTLVYRKVGPPVVAQLTFVDRTGHSLGVVGDFVPYGPFALSPDEKRVAYTRDEDLSTLWILDRGRGTSSRAALEVWASGPFWLPDGKSLLYSAATDGPPNLFVRNEGAAGECLRRSDLQNWATSLTPDGRFAIYDSEDPVTKFDIYAMPIAAPHTPFAVVKTPFRERDGKISPDGKWLAYVSDENGAREIYAVAFPDGTHRVQISNGGGQSPRWSRDGRELYYIQPQTNRLMAIAVASTGVELRPSVAVALFPLPSGLYDVTRDGRFLVTQDRVNADAPGLVVAMKR